MIEPNNYDDSDHGVSGNSYGNGGDDGGCGGNGYGDSDYGSSGDGGDGHGDGRSRHAPSLTPA